MKKIVTLFAMSALTLAFAQPPQGETRTPPQEAISACANQSEGASCSMKSPKGDTVEGTCSNTPDGKYFACKPNNPPQRR